MITTKIQICLNCPEPEECISDDRGCVHLEAATDTKKIEKGKKKDEISAIRGLLQAFDCSIPTKAVVAQLGINRNRVNLLKRQGLIQTAKIHNGRGGLRIVGVAE